MQKGRATIKTNDNLKEAFAGESQANRTYLAYAERAANSMKNAMEVEKVHHELFNEALEAVKADRDLADAPIRVCPICGHTVIGDAPGVCPVCKAKGEKFMEIA